MGELAGGGSVAVALGVVVALAVALGFIAFCSTIRTRQEVRWCPVCRIFFAIQFFSLFSGSKGLTVTITNYSVQRLEINV